MVSGINSQHLLERVTAEFLREHFAATRLPRDPLAVRMPPESDRWPTGMRKRLRAELKPAGVLIPIVERETSLTVLLTQRAPDLKHHPGQVSFPGGRLEAHDADVREAALRETHEEIGIAPDLISVIGYLESMPTITGFAVTPVVGLVRDDFDLVIDRTEVEFAFEVPLEFLLDVRNEVPVEREFAGRTVTMMELHYEGKRIWGATAMMLQSFRKNILKQ